MPATPRSRVESLLGIPMPRRPMPMARRPEPASKPTTPPAPARRAEPRAEPEVPPAKQSEPTVKAIVIDPTKKTIRETRISTSPGDQRGGFGRQLDEPTVERLVGAQDLEALDLHSGDVVIVDPLAQEDREGLWRLGDDAPVGGIGVIVGYDSEADAYTDTSLSLEEARKAVVWDTDGEGDAGELRAAITDRLDELDVPQLRKLLALLDEDAFNEAAGGSTETATVPARRYG